MGDDRGVSPVIGTLLILAIFTIVATSVIMVGRPQIVEYQERGEFQTVVNQMAAVGLDAKQLSISGSMNEVRQPSLKMPKGSFEVGEGHYLALSIGYMGEDYDDVSSRNATAGEYPGFYVDAAPGNGPTWDRGDNALELYYIDGYLPATPRLIKQEVHRWNGEAWALTHTSPTYQYFPGNNLTAVPLVLDADTGVVGTVADGPWRIRVYSDGFLFLPDTLLGDVFVFDQTRMTYHYSGESGPRTAIIENGALFVYENGRYRLERPSLIQAPHDGRGGNVLTVRTAVVEATGEDSASGRTELGFLMRVSEISNWVRSGGAAVTRVQYEGDMTELWYKHLAANGFIEDPDPARGVYHVDTQTVPGKHHAFPVHVIHSALELQVRPE